MKIGRKERKRTQRGAIDCGLPDGRKKKETVDVTAKNCISISIK